MIVPVRLARPSLVLSGADYFSKLSPYFLNMEYTDNFDGKKADDFHLQLADRDKRFINDWAPSKGVYIDVGIICERWFGPIAASISLDCGRFWIDELEFEMPQHTVSIKATSIPTEGNIKTLKEIRHWENTDLHKLADQISTENKMDPADWQSDLNPKYTNVEQTEEGSLRFLMKRASEQGIAMKVHRNKLVFIEEKKLEAAAPSFVLAYGNATGTYRMTKGHFTSKISDVLKSAKLKHAAVETGETSQASFTDPNTGLVSDVPGSGAQVVPPSAYGTQAADNVHDSTEGDEGGGDGEGDGGGNGNKAITPYAGNGGLVSGFEADTGGGSNKVKAHVRNANKDKDTATVELSIGNPLVAAGQTFTLVGVGQFDGKWFIESARHHVGDAYTTELTIRKCLTY